MRTRAFFLGFMVPFYAALPVLWWWAVTGRMIR